MPGDTAASRHLASCHLCLKLADASAHRCPRCGEALHQRKSGSLQRTLALLVTAVVLYIPANVLPIMITDQLGSAEPSTILGGVVLLIDMGSVPIAAVIFIASVMVPLGKLLALFYLCWSVSRGRPSNPRQRTVMYRATELIGKWSMVDVFVVSILVALVHLTGLLVILPGSAAVAFAGVVIVTILAAESFDPRVIWDQQEETDE
ncbi:MAG: paraquat-inducible protein A [Pseudomonadales bacterium]|nr:paraquat-inducible protein A [Halieaceae bacterium]MCP5164268.1 paraquat-inducible protein A [Pseudomonadales bacterium]MCP5189859.1 paraquat-inducible protein A [Pseudomonadales bacterium]MCP5203583.1 paraquat-inducible protein A [Pseudomonadales bacterium]